MVEEIAARCPICNGSNQCGNLAGLPAEACWCSKETFPQAIFEQIPPELLGKACLCKACLDRLKATVSDEKPGGIQLMNPIIPLEVEELLRAFVGEEIYVHSEATSYVFVRNFKVKLSQAFVAGEGPFRMAFRFDQIGWLRMEALTHYEFDDEGCLLLAGYDDRGRMNVALHIGKEPFAE